MSAVTGRVTGRMWGYTHELDSLERTVDRVVEKIHTQCAAQGIVSELDFTVTQRRQIGSRGFFTKRFISKYEYEISGGTREQCQIIATLIADLAERLS